MPEDSGNNQKNVQQKQHNLKSNVHIMQVKQEDIYFNYQDKFQKSDAVAKQDAVAKSDIYRFLDGGKSWTEIINGRVTVGFGFSMGSWENHAQHCIET